MHAQSHNADDDAVPRNSEHMQFEEGSAALERSKDELIREFRKLIDEGEALLTSTTSLSGEALAQARERFRARLTELKTRIDDLTAAGRDIGRRAVVAADGYVRENPWPAVGVATGLGFVIGALAIRR